VISTDEPVQASSSVNRFNAFTGEPVQRSKHGRWSEPSSASTPVVDLDPPATELLHSNVATCFEAGLVEVERERSVPIGDGDSDCHHVVNRVGVCSFISSSCRIDRGYIWSRGSNRPLLLP
jgi:hypothetical protein